MATSRMTAKGQITIPKELRERLGLRPKSAALLPALWGGSAGETASRQ